jgi:hypothetical protein
VNSNNLIENILKKVCEDCWINIISDFNVFNTPDHSSWHSLFTISDINQEGFQTDSIINEITSVIKKELINSLNRINKNIVCIGYYKENNIYYINGLGYNKVMGEIK